MGVVLAFDFGASTGRAIIGKIEGENNKITMKEIHRFPNEPVFLGKRFVWDFPKLLNELKISLKKAALLNETVEAIGIDTWGVDFGLLDKNDNLIGLPMHYRDERNYEGMRETKEMINLETLYFKTGIAQVSFNTCFQLVADKKYRESILKESKSILFMPDLFAYYLTGQKRNEFTIASTSGLLDIRNRKWNYELIETLGLPKGIFNDIIEPGEIYGYLSDDVMEETGLEKIPVIAVGGHDTASAVVATPLEGDGDIFLSSGTWSLLGVELNEPIINPKTYKYNFTNEGGVNNTIRLLKNINGLWLIQQLKKNWGECQYEVDFQDIISSAKGAKECSFIVDTNSEEFMNTKNMIESIKRYCLAMGQGSPKTLGELAMAIYNGLTKEYSDAIGKLEEILGYKIKGINMVGGGIQDEFLCELTAKRTCKKVTTGPIEAAVLGNILIQCIALNYIYSIEDGRRIIKESFEYRTYN